MTTPTNKQLADNLVALLDEQIKELIEETNHAVQRAEKDTWRSYGELAEYVSTNSNKQAVALAMVAALVQGIYEALSNLGQNVEDLDE